MKCGATGAAPNGTHPSTFWLSDSEAVELATKEFPEVLHSDALVEIVLDRLLILLCVVAVAPVDRA